MATDIFVLRRRLLEAQEAEHNWSIRGAATLYRDQNGETVQYRAGSLFSLQVYIRDLQDQIAMLEGVYVPSGPMRPIF